MIGLNKVVFDLFAGAGGFGHGFQMAGFDVRVSLEKDNWAVDTLRANANESSTIIHSDIRELNTEKKILEHVSYQSPDVIIGGPPCQGFSVAGPTKDPNDPRNTLFIDFAHWVDIFQPRVFVMENVLGLVSRKNGKGESVLNTIINTFEKIGYTVNVWKLNAAHYGVPQLRNRLFIVGNRNSIKIPPPLVTHTVGNTGEIDLLLKPAITIAQALDDLPYIEAGQGAEKMDYNLDAMSEYQDWARFDSELVNNHVAMVHTKRVIERYRFIQSGGLLNNLPEDIKVRKRGGEGILSEAEYNSNYRHLKRDIVSYTIPASFYSTFIHPTVPRNITSREAARIQSFPDSYVFKGKRTVISSKLLMKKGRNDENYLSQYNQIGNAVPPLLARNIADHIKKYLPSLSVEQTEQRGKNLIIDKAIHC